MTDQPQDETQQIHPEFFFRVNDIIEMTNRIERRLDSNHAELVILHAFSRYSAHHYRQVVKPEADSAEERARFADYISAEVRAFVLKHLEDLTGTSQAQAAAQDGTEA